MRKLHILAAALATSLFATASTAGPTADALASCIADNTTGKDRKDLAQWVVVAMAAHPDIRHLSKISEQGREELDKTLAKLATKLITESCAKEAKAAINAEGGASFEYAFSTLGRLAMQELTSNPAVNASFSSYTKYLDKAKFEAALSAK